MDIHHRWRLQDIEFILDHLLTVYSTYWRHLYVNIDIDFILSESNDLYLSAYLNLRHLMNFILPNAFYSINFHYRTDHRIQYDGQYQVNDMFISINSLY